MCSELEVRATGERGVQEHRHGGRLGRRRGMSLVYQGRT